MKTAVKEKITAKLALAEEYKSNKDFAAVKRIMDEIKVIREESEAEEEIAASRLYLEQGGDAAAKGKYPHQRGPMTQQEQEEFAQNDPRAAEFNSDFKPAGWVKSLSAAMQPLWIQEKMGSNLKMEAEAYKSAWVGWLRHGDAFLRNAESDALKALAEGVDTEGGYFVPEDFRAQVIHNTGVPGGLHRPACTMITTSLTDGYLPTFGSVAWGAIAEEASYTGQEATYTNITGQVSFNVRKTGGMLKISNELLADSAVNIDALLAQAFGEGHGRYEDQQIIEGDGSTEIEGLRTTATDGTVSASGTAIAIGDINQWYYDLPAQFRPNARWSTSSSFMAQVEALQVTANKGDLADAPDERLRGKPVIMFDGTGWDDASTPATNEEFGAIGDFRNYYLIDRVGMSITRDASVYVATDQIGVFARVRQDGRVGLADAFRILKSNSS